MSSDSESDPCAREKTKKKDKKEKNVKDKKSKKDKKAKKEKKAKSERSLSGDKRDRSASEGRQKKKRKDVEAPNFAPSGLLAQAGADGDSSPPPRLSLGPARPSRQDRSRSRDDPPMPQGGSHPLDRFDGDGSDSKGKGKGKGKGKDGEEPQEMEKPNFEASGLLAMEDNSKNGIPLKFTMPADSRLPDRKWRLYIFSKQNEAGKICHIHRLAGYLFGKDRQVADIPTDHPTCSKQHAVLHYRKHSSGWVKPYIMDLESTNGTFINGERIEPARYYELKESDKLKFGMSSREFVLLNTQSAD